MSLQDDLMFKHEMNGQVCLKFLNQRCLVQHIGFEYILIYSMESKISYVVSAKTMNIIKQVTVRDINLMSLCDDKVAYLAIDKTSVVDKNLL